MKSVYLLLTICICAASVSAEDIKLLPLQFTLSGPEARQTLLVEQSRDNIFVGQLKEKVTLTSSDPEVLRIKNGVAIPVANGRVTITATANNQTSKAEVTVTAMDKSFAWSFRNHVQPILMRAGCSTGACHGAAAGQNGFKLSLRGYDDEGDYLALTRQALGRRIIPSDPGRSLLLLKPTAAIPHKGGKRFEVDSMEYRVLAEWIASGAPGPRKDDPRIERIEFLPEHVVLRPASSQQFSVRAHFSDGHIEDVTRWAKYTAANASVAQVDDSGNVQVVGTGEGPITAWYLSRIAIASVTVPATNEVSPSVFARAQRRNFIDNLALEKLQDLNLPPSPRCSDAEFIRRAFLDTIGVLPTAQETREFLAACAKARSDGVPESSSDGRSSADTPTLQHPGTPQDSIPPASARDQLIESLLQRPEFVDYWSHKWSDLLLVSRSEERRVGKEW